MMMVLPPDHGGLTEEVRNIGRKVRARRDEEVKKRREIQRVDEPGLLLPVAAAVAAAADHNGGGAGGAADGEPRKSPVVMELRVVPKRPKDIAKKNPPRKRRRSLNREVEDKNVDRWMPSTDHLFVVPEDSPTTTATTAHASSSPIRSNVVQLHGLPKGVTAGQIRKFFSGLRIQRLIILPRHDFPVRELDAQESTAALRKPGLHIDRYKASALRLLLKFESAPAAAMAVQRSGEVLPCTTADTEVVGAAVRVTMVPKHYATTLVQVLAIDCPMNFVPPVEHFLHMLDHDLDATVPAILWTEAIQRLNLTTTRPALPAMITFPIFPRRKISFQLSSEQVAVLCERRDRLRKLLSQLRNKLPFPSAEVVDPTIMDPALTLNTACAKLLQDEIERADRHALIAAKWRALCLSRR
jgi:hypothetical protein